VNPSPKYALVALLHRAGPAGVWEHALHRELQPRYERSALYGVREDLVSLSTIGWVHTVDERAHGRALLRRYALADHIRSFVEYQLDLPALFAFLDEVPTPVPAGSRA
jgi:hypothetical protein